MSEEKLSEEGPQSGRGSRAKADSFDLSAEETGPGSKDSDLRYAP